MEKKKCQWIIEGKYCSKPDVLKIWGCDEMFPACSTYEGSEYCFSKEPKDYNEVYAEEIAREKAEKIKAEQEKLNQKTQYSYTEGEETTVSKSNSSMLKNISFMCLLSFLLGASLFLGQWAMSTLIDWLFY